MKSIVSFNLSFKDLSYDMSEDSLKIKNKIFKKI